MAKNIRLLGTDYSSVPAVTLPTTTGGTATFTDNSDATITASTVLSGAIGYGASGKVVGSVVVHKYYTGTNTPSSSLGSDGDLYFKVN